MGKELAKAYEPHEVEERIYEFWMNGKYFHAEVDSKKKPYTIVIPPPNITGQLHMGYASPCRVVEAAVNPTAP